jgi:putative ABC transport system permease protein
MFSYYLRLALKSFARDPGSTALMVFAIALGIGVCVMTLTVYHAMSSNPISWKNDRLYAVTMDSWHPERPANRNLPQLPPMQLTYTDATYLFNSTIPERKALSYQTRGVLLIGSGNDPMKTDARVTTADFFPMFDVPFRYGAAWNAQADMGPEPVMVISHDLNEKLFGGANSVGRIIRWSGHDFRIVGVLAPWMPQPKFYDLIRGNFEEPEPLYVPWGWGKALQLRCNRVTVWKTESIDTFDQLLGSEATWIGMWVELPNATARERMQTLLDTYWAEQRKAGRFQRPRNNRLSTVSQWLEEHEVVQNDDRLLVGLAFAFLCVCLLNTIGLLLAKFLNGAPTAGVRRALGASRMEIFMQHLVQAGALAFAGGVLGLLFGALFLRGVRALYGGDPDAGLGGYQALAHLDTTGIAWTVVLAVAAVLITGLYPAWRIGRVPPATYLKSQ